MTGPITSNLLNQSLCLVAERMVPCQRIVLLYKTWVVLLDSKPINHLDLRSTATHLLSEVERGKRGDQGVCGAFWSL